MDSFKKDSINILEYKNEKITLKTSMGADGVLVLSENALPGWSVFVDGNQHLSRDSRSDVLVEKMLTVNICFRAVKLDKGKHKIIWKYTTPGLKLGAVISGVTILLAAFFLKINSRRRKNI